MLQNGMVSGSAAHWDAIHAAGNDIDALADEVIAEAIQALGTHDGLAAAINEAQGSGGIDGAVLAAILLPIDTAARWKALTRIANDLIVAASLKVIYREPGIPFARYSDLDSGSIDANVTPSIRDGVAEKLAGRFGKSAELAS